MADILVVHDDAGPSADDTNLINFLTGKGHTVDTAIETAALPDAGYDACIVTESGSSGSTAINSIDTCLLPVMMFETSVNTALLATAGLTAGSSGTQWDLQGDPFGLNAGFPDPLTVFTSSQSFYQVATSALPSGAQALAIGQGTGTQCTAWVVDAGGALTTGNAPNRRIAMGLITSRLSGIVAGTDSGNWFNSAVEWLAGASAGPNEGDATGAVSWAGSATGLAPPPAVPTGLTATAVSATQIDLDWDSMTGATGYDIERDGTIIVFDHPTSSYSDTGLTANTEYDYRVRQVTA